MGTVYIVGAGPGDPGLITVKGLELLRRADVVLYDRLIPKQLLHETRPGAELIDVGKVPAGTRQEVSIDRINALLVARASEGRLVVRLKGGDPFVFGRGGEEALACGAAGVPFVIVPGVSSAVAVPAYAGVPVTHRGLAAAFTVFAGHEDPAKAGKVDYEALVRSAESGTLVLLMGVRNLLLIVRRLLATGLPADTPAICIEQGTTERQRSVEGALRDLPALVSKAGIAAPAITVIGQVVSLRHAGVRWHD